MNVRKTILHIDDDPAILKLIAAKLTAHGYEVVSCSEPVDVEELLLASNARVVLLDIKMPDADGLELLKQIKRYDGGVQVIMLTGVVSMNAVLDSIRLGAEALCFKPIRSFEPLLEVIEESFRKTRRWRETVEELRARRAPAVAMA